MNYIPSLKQKILAVISVHLFLSQPFTVAADQKCINGDNNGNGHITCLGNEGKPALNLPDKPNTTEPGIAENRSEVAAQGGKSLTKPRNFNDATTGMEFIAVKGGCYQMGDSFGDGYTTEDGIAIERPVHEVCLSDFFMGKYEVTVHQFSMFIAETGYLTEAERNTGNLAGCYSFEFNKSPFLEYRDWANWKKPNLYLSNLETHPVTCVSWNDARAFAAWLKSKTSISYRLPTEAEWEYAARGGTTLRNYWGDGTRDTCRYGNVSDRTKLDGGRSWPDQHDCYDGYPYVAPVGMFKPNNFGLYDMMGNVWEWVEDNFDSTFYQWSKTRDNPEGPKSGSTRIYRGGSWRSGPMDVRAAFRPNLQLGRRYYDVGFRLVFPAKERQVERGVKQD